MDEDKVSSRGLAEFEGNNVDFDRNIVGTEGYIDRMLFCV